MTLSHRSRLKNEADRLNSEADLQKQLEETEQKYAALQKQMEQGTTPLNKVLSCLSLVKKNICEDSEGKNLWKNKRVDVQCKLYTVQVLGGTYVHFTLS